MKMMMGNMVFAPCWDGLEIAFPPLAADAAVKYGGQGFDILIALLSVGHLGRNQNRRSSEIRTTPEKRSALPTYGRLTQSYSIAYGLPLRCFEYTYQFSRSQPQPIDALDFMKALQLQV